MHGATVKNVELNLNDRQ